MKYEQNSSKNNDWKQCYLEDILEFQRGFDLPKSKMIPGPYPVIGSNGIIGYHNQFTTDSPSVSIGRSGNIGNPFIYFGKSWCHNTTLFVKKFKCDPLFSYYLLKTIPLYKYSGGSAVPTLNRNHIKRIPIRIPVCIGNQQKISNFLQQFDRMIELNNKIIKKLEDLSNLYVHNALFSQSFPKNPTRLSTIAEIHQESFNPKKHAGIVVEHYSIPAFDSEKYPTFELSDNIQSNKNKISDNYVLFSKLNPSTKRVWRPLCLTSYPITSTEFVALRPKEGYSKDLIFAIINSDEFNSFICTKTTGSTNSRQRVRPSDALLFEFFLPCPEQLAQLDKFIHPIYQLQSILIQQNIFLKNIRDSLLPKLFSGEIELKN